MPTAHNQTQHIETQVRGQAVLAADPVASKRAEDVERLSHSAWKITVAAIPSVMVTQ
jgi:hypothetical protein